MVSVGGGAGVSVPGELCEVEKVSGEGLGDDEARSVWVYLQCSHPCGVYLLWTEFDAGVRSTHCSKSPRMSLCKVGLDHEWDDDTENM